MTGRLYAHHRCLLFVAVSICVAVMVKGRVQTSAIFVKRAGALQRKIARTADVIRQLSGGSTQLMQAWIRFFIVWHETGMLLELLKFSME